MKNLKVTKIAAAAGAAGAALALGVVSQSAFADANLLPAIKVGGGWVSVVSYINTQQPATASDTVFVHATHQSKDLSDLTAACLHVDGRSPTTVNDLTTTVLDTPGGAVGSVFPTADNVGGAIINPGNISLPSSEGFLVLENYSASTAGTTTGTLGTLTSEAIVFNLASGYLYGTRGLSVTHLAPSPNGNVNISVPDSVNGGAGLTFGNVLLGNTGNFAPHNSSGNVADPNGNGATLTRFAFLPPGAPALTAAYVIPTNTTTTIAGSLVANGYAATMTFETRMDAAQSHAQGIYDRLEGARSLSVTNTVTCVGQLTLQQLTGNSVPSFIANGGWFNFTGVNNTGNPPAAPATPADSALALKVEWAPGYGLSVQPLHQQWYTK